MSVAPPFRAASSVGDWPAFGASAGLKPGATSRSDVAGDSRDAACRGANCRAPPPAAASQGWHAEKASGATGKFTTIGGKAGNRGFFPNRLLDTSFPGLTHLVTLRPLFR